MLCGSQSYSTSCNPCMDRPGQQVANGPYLPPAPLMAGELPGKCHSCGLLQQLPFCLCTETAPHIQGALLPPSLELSV